MKTKQTEVENKFLVIDLLTGRMDGFYRRKESAVEAFHSLSKKMAGNWIVTEILAGNDKRLPDNLFHATCGSVANENLIIKSMCQNSTKYQN